MIYGIVVVMVLAVGYFDRRAGTVQGFADGAGVDTFGLYYASWCPHCKDVKPIFDQWGAAKGSVQVNGKTVFVKMYEESADKDKMAGKPVRGFPTFLLEKSDGKIIECNEDRSPEGWMKFLKANV